MRRITFCIENNLAKAAEQKATSDRRSLSAYIARLVEQDITAAKRADEANAIFAEAQAHGIDLRTLIKSALRRRN